MGRRSFIVTRGGVNLWFREFGQGTPLLFLHSALVDSRFWDYQVVHLARRGFRCICLDRRGHGRSDHPAGGYDYDTLADDVAEVIEALDLRKVSLIGHSMGCGEVIRYVSRHGSSRVARIALLGSVTPYLAQARDNPNGIPPAAAEAVRELWRQDFSRWVDENIDAFLTPDSSSAMRQWTKQLVAGTSLPVALACNETVMNEDFRDELRDIDVPCLMLHGECDASAPLELTARASAALIPESLLKVYPGAAHGLLFTHVRQVNEDLTAFLEMAQSAAPAHAAAGRAPAIQL